MYLKCKLTLDERIDTSICCFQLFAVFVLQEANQLLAVALHRMDRSEWHQSSNLNNNLSNFVCVEFQWVWKIYAKQYQFNNLHQLPKLAFIARLKNISKQTQISGKNRCSQTCNSNTPHLSILQLSVCLCCHQQQQQQQKTSSFITSVYLKKHESEISISVGKLDWCSSKQWRAFFVSL